jgi:hypothetical protein
LHACYIIMHKMIGINNFNLSSKCKITNENQYKKYNFLCNDYSKILLYLIELIKSLNLTVKAFSDRLKI